MINWTKKDPELCPILGESSTGATCRRSVNTMDPHRGPLSRRTRFLLVVCILFTELCERLTFYGIVANLVLYCRDFLKLEAPLPSSISLAFQGRFLNFLVDIYLRNREHVPCFYRIMETRLEVWENEKCCGNTSRNSTR